MVKSIKYILKRILIGVGIALALMIIKGNLFTGVLAKEVSSFNWGSHQFTPLVTSTSTDFTLTSDSSLINAGNGEILFSFSIFNNNQNKTPIVNNVRVYSGSSSFTCNFGSVNNASGGGYNPTTNQTINGSSAVSYSVVCPVDLGSDGLTRVGVFYLPWGQGSQETFTITFSPYFSFIKDNDSTQEIIDNQNDNTEAQIESQKVCSTHTIDNTSGTEKGLLNSDGSKTVTDYYIITDYIEVEDSLKVVYEPITSRDNYICFYTLSKSLISCSNQRNFSVGQIINVPTNTKYVRATINIDSNKPRYEFDICKNGNQAIADSQKDINNTLNDSTGVDNSEVSDLFGDVESSDTPISDLLTMPITLLQAYINGFSSNCSPFNLGTLYGQQIILPCVNLEDYLGSELWSLIDLLFSLFMFYNIAKLIISAFENLTSLKDDFNLLYAKHYNQEYQGRHAG